MTKAFPEIAPQPRLSLVIPTYNERDSLPSLLERLIKLLNQTYGGACESSPCESAVHETRTRATCDYEIIVVDDDSPDGTGAIAVRLAQTYPQLKVMRRHQEQGLASAIVRGWQAAQGDLLGVLDADGQHPPEAIAKLLQVFCRDEVDVAIASRYGPEGKISGWPWHRRLLSRGAQGLGWLLLPEVVSRVSDPMSGCFLVRRRAIAGCPLSPLSYKILLEVLARGRVHRIAEVGYEFCARRSGLSKVGWRQYRDYLLHLGQLRWALWGRRYRRRPHKN